LVYINDKIVYEPISPFPSNSREIMAQESEEVVAFEVLASFERNPIAATA
jgi:hypothetical protein